MTTKRTTKTEKYLNFKNSSETNCKSPEEATENLLFDSTEH